MNVTEYMRTCYLSMCYLFIETGKKDFAWNLFLKAVGTEEEKV